MLSKFLDVANYCAAFHHQSQAYKRYRPPAFGDHEQLKNMTRERERQTILTEETILSGIEQKREQEIQDKKSWWKLLPGSSKKKKEHTDLTEVKFPAAVASGMQEKLPS